MKKKILSTLLALCMVFAMLPASAMAADEVTLAEVLARSYNENEGVYVIDEDVSVVVGADLELGAAIEIAAGKEVTIDLNGNTISQTKYQSAAYSMINNKGTLTITDNSSEKDGKISYTDSGTVELCNYVSNTILNSGTLTVSGGTIENLSGETVASNGYPHAIDTRGTLYIDGGEVSNEKYSAIRIWCTTANMNTVAITGGTVHGAVDLHNVDGNANKGQLTISNNAKLECNGANPAAIRLLGFGANVENLSATISGGSINGKVIVCNYINAAEGTFDSVYNVTGGTFSDFSAMKYLAEGADVTIELADSVEVAESIVIPAKTTVTLDLNGQTISGVSSEAAASAVIENKGTLTIKDTVGGGKITTKADQPDTDWDGENPEDQYPSYANNTIANRGKLTVMSGTIENTSPAGGACYTIDNYDGGSVTVEGGAICNTNYPAIRMFAGSATKSNTVTINNGTVTGTRAVWLHLAGSDTSVAPQAELTVTNGTLTGTGEGDYTLAVYSYSYGNSMANTKLTIEDGEFIGDVALTGGKNKTVAETVTITGGSFTDVYSYAAQEVAAETINISGGTFATQPAADYLASGCVFVECDGVYTIFDKAVVVTFDADGGSVSPNKKDVTYGEIFGELPTPTRAGYEFDGWYDGDTEVTASTEVGSVDDVTLTAKWTAKDWWTVTYHTNGGGEDFTVTYKYGEEVTKPENPTKSGYTFKGWFCEESLTTEYVFTEVADSEEPVEGMNLYAKWAKKSSGTTTPPITSTTEKNEDGSVTTTVIDKTTGTVTETTTKTTTEKTEEGTVTTEEKVEEKVEANGTVTKTETTTTTTEDAVGNTTTEEVVKETVKAEDGTKTVTETKKTEAELANGSTGTTTVAADGATTAEAAISEKAVEEAGETPVTLPVAAVETTKTTKTATTVTVSVPKSAGEVEVEIPVADMTAGTVAVIVDEEGNETVITDAVPTENGLVLTVEGDVTLKIVDNSKDFDDVSEKDWEKDAVDFNTSRNIMNGMGGNTFQPDATTTRAMVWTMLARLSGVDTSTGSTWDEVGRNWAMANGISDGTNGDAEITREQLATMLYRFMGAPETNYTIDHFHDHHETSDWAREAKEWAVGTGVLNGKGNADGTLSLDPQGNATRAEVAQMFMNFLMNHKI